MSDMLALLAARVFAIGDAMPSRARRVTRIVGGWFARWSFYVASDTTRSNA